MENTIYTVVSYDGKEYGFTKDPDHHTTYENAFNEFNEVMQWGTWNLEEEEPYEIAIIAYPSLTHFKENKSGEIINCTPNWHEVFGTGTKFPEGQLPRIC